MDLHADWLPKSCDVYRREGETEVGVESTMVYCEIAAAVSIASLIEQCRALDVHISSVEVRKERRT